MSREYFFVAVLLFAFAAQAFYQVVHISATFDEPITIATGYYYLKTGDFRLNPTHPSFHFQFSALPLLFMKPQPVLPLDSPGCAELRHWECTEAFVSANAGRFGQILFFARIPHIIIGVFLGFVIYAWSRRLYGQKAALLSLLLFAFSPVLISFSGTALQNIAVTFFILLTSFLFWEFLQRPSFRRLLLAGLSFGFALGSEYTAFLLVAVFVPFFAVSLFLRKLRLRGLMAIAAVVLFAAFVVLFVSYRGQFTTLASSVPPHYSDYLMAKVYPVFEGVPVFERAVPFFVERVPVPFASFWSGVAWQFVQVAGGLKANFFAGEVYYRSNPIYFAANMFFKTPLPLLGLFAAGLAMFWKSRRRVFASGEWVLLLLPLVFLAFLANSARIDGPSHMLPIYVFVVIIAGRSLVGRFSSRPLKLAVVILSGWYVLGTLAAMPHYFGYFNELLPQEKAYGLFSDSSNDLGQELRHLSLYLHENKIGKVKLSYLGSVNPSVEGVIYDYLPSPGFQAWVPNSTVGREPVVENCSPAAGVIAVSVANLNGVHLTNNSCYSWLKPYKPVANIGGSILVYAIS